MSPKTVARWRCLYRALDQYGQVIDVMPSEQRNNARERRSAASRTLRGSEVGRLAEASHLTFAIALRGRSWAFYAPC